MLFKYPIIIFIFFILAIIQNSFMPFFNVMGTVPNLVFILFFILTFFEESSEYHSSSQVSQSEIWEDKGFFIAIIAGFFLDIFSPFYFGLSIISPLIIYLLIKVIIHFLRKWQDKYLIFYFLFIFLFSFFVYNVFSNLLSNSFHLKLDFNKTIFVSLLYNLIFIYFGFYVYKFIKKDSSDSQLKLF